MDYFILKWIHIISSTILFGTGIGSAFYMFMANRRKEPSEIYFAIRHVVIADWVFTTPSVIIQFITGMVMMHIGGYDFSYTWIRWGVILYFFVGACWLPVVWIQMKMYDIAKSALDSGQELPKEYWKMDKIWIMLGSIAFPVVIIIFYLPTHCELAF